MVEDEQSIADTVLYAFESAGFEVIHVQLGELAIDLFKKFEISFVIIDVGLPDMSGFNVCKELRKTSDVPILF